MVKPVSTGLTIIVYASFRQKPIVSTLRCWWKVYAYAINA